MKVITEPTVTLIAKQTFLGHPEYAIPSDGNDATKIGAFAAKGCYDSFGENGRANEANQLAILEHQHGSVLEHITFTLFIEGITRALSLESNRHRQLAVSQRSTRYTAEEDSAIVLEPYYADLYNKQGNISNAEQDLLDAFLASCEATLQDYQDQVNILMEMNPLELKGFDLRKWARGKARNILPHALETRITYTGNVRAWRWFIESRSDKHAEPEIRRLADFILKVLREEAPIYFGDFAVTEMYDGMPVWVPAYRKV
jgi:thymidylate synthase (FAD)